MASPRSSGRGGCYCYHQLPCKSAYLSDRVFVVAHTVLQLVFLRVQSSVLVSDLFQECEPITNFYGLCECVSAVYPSLWPLTASDSLGSPNSTLRNVVLLLLTAGIKLLLTAWTFGIQVPAGIFLPSITIGATMGRAVGLIMSAKDAILFNASSADSHWVTSGTLCIKSGPCSGYSILVHPNLGLAVFFLVSTPLLGLPPCWVG
jgi:Voltage gated chloride channel